MKKRPALGRGIDALFEEYKAPEEEAAIDESRIQNISILLIDPNKDQPRKTFDQEKLEQLSQSIRQVGILQPIVVAMKGERYQIIAGERRWRASRMAGLAEVPCIVRDVDLIRRMEMSLIENLQRDDLNPMESAMSVSNLITQCAITQEEAASRLGMSRPALTNLLRLLGLDKEVQTLIAQGLLSEGHGRALAGVEPSKQRFIGKLAAEKGLSVRQVEQMCREEKQRKKPKKEKPLAELGLLEEAARKTFGVKVSVSGTASKGVLTLHYATPAELERIYEILHQD